MRTLNEKKVKTDRSKAQHNTIPIICHSHAVSTNVDPIQIAMARTHVFICTQFMSLLTQSLNHLNSTQQCQIGSNKNV